jgi:hypothetical protein
MCPACISSTSLLTSSAQQELKAFDPAPNQYQTGDGIDLFVFDFIKASVAPMIQNLTFSSHKYHIALYIVLDSVGTVTCGTFLSSYNPSSVNEIYSSGYKSQRGNCDIHNIKLT